MGALKHVGGYTHMSKSSAADKFASLGGPGPLAVRHTVMASNQIDKSRKKGILELR